MEEFCVDCGQPYFEGHNCLEFLEAQTKYLEDLTARTDAEYEEARVKKDALRTLTGEAVKHNNRIK